MATSSLQDSDFAELQRRLVVLRVGLLLVVALLALRLWHLQIREGPYYQDLSENNRTRSVILERRAASSSPQRRLAGQ
jgi:penicillin-binding protein 2